VLTQVVIPVPASGPSAWFPSTLTRIKSAGLSSGALADDSIVLCGSNLNLLPVTTDFAIARYAGYPDSSQTNAGTAGFALGAFLYYAVIRTGGSAAGLNFVLAGAT